MKWKDGDWGFHEYTLKQFVVKGGKVQEASCGQFRISGRNLGDECRPLTLRNAALSSVTAYWSDRLHREGHAGLNYPDIHRKLVELWCAACDAMNDKESAEAIGAFANKVLSASGRQEVVDGVPLLRQRLA